LNPEQRDLALQAERLFAKWKADLEGVRGGSRELVRLASQLDSFMKFQ